jgi:chorismate dehydratase
LHKFGTRCYKEPDTFEGVRYGPRPGKFRVRKGVVTVKQIHIGASKRLAVQPLIFGLTEKPTSGVTLRLDEPGCLAAALERGDLDAALIPSIEYLRGVGGYSLSGPALVAKSRTKSVMLVTDRPLSEIGRIAVDEHSRTPLVVVRVVLHKLYGILPDLCVLKRPPLGAGDWKGDYHGILLTDDEGLRYCTQDVKPDEICHDIGEMWNSIHSRPLVQSLWAFNDETLKGTLESILNASRDYGLNNLSRLAESMAHSSPLDAESLRRYFETAWGFHLGPEERKGLWQLEDEACEYQLLQGRRREKVLIG